MTTTIEPGGTVLTLSKNACANRPAQRICAGWVGLVNIVSRRLEDQPIGMRWIGKEQPIQDELLMKDGSQWNGINSRTRRLPSMLTELEAYL